MIIRSAAIIDGICEASIVVGLPRLIPLVFALIAALVSIVLLLYVPQTRAARRRWAWLLIGLRITGLCGMAISIIQPVIQRPPRPEDTGAIVLLVDRSRGMSLKDRQLNASQLVALADGLNRLPAGTRVRMDEFSSVARTARERFDRYVAVIDEFNFATMNGLDSGESRDRLRSTALEFTAAATDLTHRRSLLRPKAAPSPVLAALDVLLDEVRKVPFNAVPASKWIIATRTELDRVGSAIDTMQSEEDSRLYSASKAVHAACDSLRELSRLQLVEQALCAADGGLLKHLAAKLPVYGFSIGTSLRVLPLHGDGQPVRRLLLDAGGAAPDIGRAVREAMDQLRGVKVRAVVVFSPGGAALTGPPTINSAPVFTVAVAPAYVGRDVAVSRLLVPSEVIAGEPVTVRAKVNGINLRGSPVGVLFMSTEIRTLPPVAATPLTLAAASARAAITMLAIDVRFKRIILGDDGKADVAFTTRFTRSGNQGVEIRLTGVPQEIITDNNFARSWINVLPGGAPTVLLGGAPGWEYRFLRDIVSANATFELFDEVVDEGAAVSLSPEELRKKRLFIFYDLPASALSTAQWDAVHRVVSEEGGTAVLVAGSEHLPADYLASPVTADLLPYTATDSKEVPLMTLANWVTWQGSQAAFRIMPSAGSPLADAISLTDTPLETQQRWATLPGIFSYLALPRLRASARALLVEAHSQAPIVTQHSLGLGKVLFVGTSELWRLGARSGAHEYEQLWLRLLARVSEPRYAIEQHTDAGSIYFSVPPEVEWGTPARVRAKIVAENGDAHDAGRLFVRVVSAKKSPMEFQPAPDQVPASGRFTFEIAGIESGEYRVELHKQGGAEPLAAGMMRVAAADPLEAQDIAGDRALLTRIAESSGGEALSLETLRNLPDRLEAKRQQQAVPVVVTLYDSAYLFLFIVGCLTAEWSLRKLVGLA